METENLSTDSPGTTTCETSCCFDSVRRSVADTLHSAAEKLGRKAGSLEEDSDMARYGRQAADWLEQSAECVRRFEWDEADREVRSYIRENPARSLMMAGAAGLLLGIMLRRR